MTERIKTYNWKNSVWKCDGWKTSVFPFYTDPVSDSFMALIKEWEKSCSGSFFLSLNDCFALAADFFSPTCCPTRPRPAWHTWYTTSWTPQVRTGHTPTWLTIKHQRTYHSIPAAVYWHAFKVFFYLMSSTRCRLMPDSPLKRVFMFRPQNCEA